MKIVAEPSATTSAASTWAKRKGATDEFVGLAALYWQLASMHGGVDPAVAYAQAAKETGRGRFGGVIDASFHNPCGLKRREGGDNSDPKAHARFRSWRIGITAHLDHLALYAGSPGYPRPTTPDPRHFPQLRGQAITVEALGGKWAPSPTYGKEIVKAVREMASSKTPRSGDAVDGCELDFTENPTTDDELEDLLMPEEDEDAS
jgi:N-acetylmuramoyl-L-alanine amidase